MKEARDSSYFAPTGGFICEWVLDIRTETFSMEARSYLFGFFELHCWVEHVHFSCSLARSVPLEGSFKLPNVLHWPGGHCWMMTIHNKHGWTVQRRDPSVRVSHRQTLVPGQEVKIPVGPKSLVQRNM